MTVLVLFIMTMMVGMMRMSMRRRRRGGGGRPRRITVTHADGWLIVVAGIASVCDPGAVFHSILDVRLSNL